MGGQIGADKGQWWRRLMLRLPVVRDNGRLTIRGARRAKPPEVEHGESGVRQVGHRRYVGGMWDEIGRLQFEFLVAQGLRPHHFLLDIGCGSLRGGVHFILYLDPGHYLGIEKEKELVERGIELELGREAYDAKGPQFVISGTFEFNRFSSRPNFALAQSVFSHLPGPEIERCLAHLRPVIHDDGMFFATFFESTAPVENPSDPHDHKRFVYTQSQMVELGQRHDWSMEYIGDWKHPRGQIMVKYTPA